ncbi:hypothetical protein BC629DRAFT_1187886 [Irpex lacteus]|nr:hypothetical protein BC629DRAFT_1187886 [Irpex lacteus]
MCISRILMLCNSLAIVLGRRHSICRGPCTDPRDGLSLGAPLPMWRNTSVGGLQIQHSASAVHCYCNGPECSGEAKHAVQYCVARATVY